MIGIWLFLQMLENSIMLVNTLIPQFKMLQNYHEGLFCESNEKWELSQES